MNEEIQYQDAYYTYIERGYQETKVNNLVSAIYLNYRVFDTLFEALLLAVSVTAVVYFAAPWEKTKEEEDE
jgi:multisubunit Na+/H+ antiporter MnhB subunit